MQCSIQVGWLSVFECTLCIPHTHAQLFNGPFSGTTRVGRYQKGKTNLDLTEARDGERVAVASAGPYASLHHAPDRQPRQHPTTRFLQAGCPSCRPTNSVKALKALCGFHTLLYYIICLVHSLSFFGNMILYLHWRIFFMLSWQRHFYCSSQAHPNMLRQCCLLSIHKPCLFNSPKKESFEVVGADFTGLMPLFCVPPTVSVHWRALKAPMPTCYASFCVDPPVPPTDIAHCVYVYIYFRLCVISTAINVSTSDTLLPLHPQRTWCRRLLWWTTEKRRFGASFCRKPWCDLLQKKFSWWKSASSRSCWSPQSWSRSSRRTVKVRTVTA